MGRDDGITWEEMVTICSIFLLVIALSAILFWVFIACIVIGFVWLYSVKDDGEGTIIPLFIIVGGILGAVIFWAIGYWFPGTPIGHSLTEAASTIVKTDDTINEALTNVTKDIIN